MAAWHWAIRGHGQGPKDARRHAENPAEQSQHQSRHARWPARSTRRIEDIAKVILIIIASFSAKTQPRHGANSTNVCLVAAARPPWHATRSRTPDNFKRRTSRPLFF